MTIFTRVLAELDRTDRGLTFLGGPAPIFVSYRSLGARVRGNVDHFASLGVGRGDRVAIALETDLEHVVAFLALLAIGATPLSLKPRRGSPEEHARTLHTLVERFDVRFAYHSAGAGPGAKSIAWKDDAMSERSAALAAVRPEDIAFVQFSSGSLGDPKAVPIRHESLMDNIGAILGVDQRPEDILVYNFLPLSHDMGLVGGLLSNLVLQNDLHLSPMGHFLRRPTQFLADTKRDCGFAMPDFALRYLLRFLDARKRATDAGILGKVRTIYCGAEPIRHETITTVLEAAPRYGLDPRALLFCYGMAEATLMVTSHKFESLERSFSVGPRGRPIASVGKPVGNTELRIDATPGEEGPIFVRGPSVFAGYLDDAPLPGGWHDTGDLGFLRGGDVYISGRAKDVVIVNGENIFASDIEAFASRLAGVAESLALIDGDRFYLLLIPESDIDRHDVSARIAGEFGVAPAGIALGVTRSILRTTSGKPMRAATLAELRKAGAFDE